MENSYWLFVEGTS